MSLRKSRLPNSVTANMRRDAARDIAKAKKILDFWRGLRFVLQREPEYPDVADALMIHGCQCRLKNLETRCIVLSNAQFIIRRNLMKAR